MMGRWTPRSSRTCVERGSPSARAARQGGPLDPGSASDHSDAHAGSGATRAPSIARSRRVHGRVRPRRERSTGLYAEAQTLGPAEVPASDDELRELADVWQDADIPAAQRRVVDVQLANLAKGEVDPVFAALAEALQHVDLVRFSILDGACASGYYSEVIRMPGILARSHTRAATPLTLHDRVRTGASTQRPVLGGRSRPRSRRRMTASMSFSSPASSSTSRTTRRRFGNRPARPRVPDRASLSDGVGTRPRSNDRDAVQHPDAADVLLAAAPGVGGRERRVRPDRDDRCLSERQANPRCGRDGRRYGGPDTIEPDVDARLQEAPIRLAGTGSRAGHGLTDRWMAR